MTYLWITIGSALGGLLRYAITRATLNLDNGFPFGTVLVNVLGCFLIGFFGTFTLPGSRYAVPENITAFCDGRDLRRLHHLLGLQPADLRSGAIRRVGTGSGKRYRLGCTLLRLGGGRPSSCAPYCSANGDRSGSRGRVHGLIAPNEKAHPHRMGLSVSSVMS